MTGATDSLKELADALDEALDRLAAGYDSQRRFASNASHELRTNERSERLIAGLLILAESDRGLQGKVPIRLDELTGSVLDTHRELADKHQVSLHRRAWACPSSARSRPRTAARPGPGRATKAG